MTGFVDCDGESDFGGVSRIVRRIVNQFQPSPLNTGALVAGRARRIQESESRGDGI
jgi:hypothetical protein